MSRDSEIKGLYSWLQMDEAGDVKEEEWYKIAIRTKRQLSSSL